MQVQATSKIEAFKAIYFGYCGQANVWFWGCLCLAMRAAIAYGVYFMLLIPVLWNRPTTATVGRINGASLSPKYLPSDLAEKPEQVGVFLTAIDTWSNQLISLALALFLLIAWLFKNVVRDRERQRWLDGLSLLSALTLTLWSITAGMELKWFGVVTGHVLLDLIVVEPGTSADFLRAKIFMQGRLMLAALALTLTCLPALWHKDPP